MKGTKRPGYRLSCPYCADVIELDARRIAWRQEFGAVEVDVEFIAMHRCVETT